jgi:anti-sigma B factor antagonist
MTEREVEGVSVLTLDGRLVLGDEANALRDKVKDLIEAGRKNLVLKVSSLTFVDSAGLGALVGVYHSVRARGGSLRLCEPQPKLEKLLKLTNLSALLEVSSSEADALRAFSS